MKEASLFEGRDVEEGLFGEDAEPATRGPEDTITKVNKSSTYTGILIGRAHTCTFNSIVYIVGGSIFDESAQAGKKSAKMTLLDEDNSEDLFIPSGVRTGRETKDDLFTTEDNTDLLE